MKVEGERFLPLVNGGGRRQRENRDGSGVGLDRERNSFLP